MEDGINAVEEQFNIVMWWVWGNPSNKQIITENDIKNVFLAGTESYILTETMFDNKIKYSTVNIVSRAG